ncbi:hypothetical protein [Methylobacterium radiotolerans]|uniref:hypothetical protein n=1 Tax=Methylobacterium radiotolerans TaxID=31998 RepID=UPI0015F77096|nr:hypothetical protein [Methylobacterium radiotolerans]
MAIVEELIGRLRLETKGVGEAKKATKELENFRKALKGLAGAARMNFDGPTRAAKAFTALRKEADKLAAAQKKAGSGASFDKADASAKRHLSTVQKLRAAYVETAKAQAALGRGGKLGGGKSWLTGELDAIRRYKRELQEVRREAAKLGVPRRVVDRTHGIPYGERSKFGEAIAAGTIARGAGTATRYAVEQGAATKQETNRQYNAGMDAKQIAELERRAQELSAQYPSIDANKIRGMGRDARNMFPTFEKGMEALPEIVKAQVMLQAAKGVDAADNELGDFLKGADILGHTENVGDFKDLLNSYVKAVQVEGRQLPLSEYKNLAKYSKAGGVNLSNEFMGAIAPTFMQSEGGARFGTQIAAGIGSLISGRRTKKSTAALAELGLLDKKGNLKDAEKYQTNPYQYAIENMMPALKKKGVDVNDDKAVQGRMAKIFSNSMVENLFTKLITQRDQVERNVKTYRSAKGLDAAKGQTRSDPYLSLEGVTAQFRNLLGTTQKENIGLAGKAGATLAESMGDLNKRLASDPVAAQAVGVGTGAVAAGITGAAGLKLWRVLSGWFGVGKQGVVGAGGAAAGGAAGAAVGAGVAEGATVAGAAAGSRGVMAVAGGILRGLLRLAPAVSAPLTMDASKDDQRKQMLRLGKYAEEQNRARAAAEAVQEKPRAWVDPPKHDAAKGVAGFNGDVVKARLAEIQPEAEKLRTTLENQITLKIDSSGIDTAQAKAEKLIATMGKASSAIASAGGGLAGSALAKGSNTFTSPGATAP